MSERRPISETGFTDLNISVRVGDIHVFGILHHHPLTIALLTGAITRYEPDVAAIEACEAAIMPYHPDAKYGEGQYFTSIDAQWPPQHELEAAAYATDRLYDLRLAGISTLDFECPSDQHQVDAEIFVDLGILDSPDDLIPITYFELDLPTVRKWNEMTKTRTPGVYQSVIDDRDSVMAGHLRALENQEDVTTIVAAVGVQHLTGIIDRLSNPSKIPEDHIVTPPLQDHQQFPRDSPYSIASSEPEAMLNWLN